MDKLCESVCTSFIFPCQPPNSALSVLLGPVCMHVWVRLSGSGGVHGRSEREMHKVTVSIQLNNMSVCTSVGVGEYMQYNSE